MTEQNQDRKSNIKNGMEFIKGFLGKLAEVHKVHPELKLYENSTQTRSGVEIYKIKESGEPDAVFGRVEFDHDFLNDHDFASIEEVLKGNNFAQLFPTLPNSHSQTLPITANGTVMPPM